MNLTEEKVHEILKTNPDFKDLPNEMSGPFYLIYHIGNNTVLVSNTSAGVAETFLMIPFDDNTIQDAVDFARIAKSIVDEIIKKTETL